MTTLRMSHRADRYAEHPAAMFADLSLPGNGLAQMMMIVNADCIMLGGGVLQLGPRPNATCVWTFAFSRTSTGIRGHRGDVRWLSCFIASTLANHRDILSLLCAARSSPSRTAQAGSYLSLKGFERDQIGLLPEPAELFTDLPLTVAASRFAGVTLSVVPMARDVLIGISVALYSDRSERYVDPLDRIILRTLADISAHHQYLVNTIISQREHPLVLPGRP
jgi:hypothetical protein